MTDIKKVYNSFLEKVDSYLFGYPVGVRGGGVFWPAVSSTRSGGQPPEPVGGAVALPLGGPRPPEAGSGPLSDRQHALSSGKGAAGARAGRDEAVEEGGGQPVCLRAACGDGGEGLAG